MRRITTSSVLALALGLGVAACGDSVTATSGDTITSAEASELANAIVAAADFGFSALGPAPAAAPGAEAGSAGSITITIDQTGECDGGGSVAVKGKVTANINDAQTSGSLSFDYTLAPSACDVQTQAGTVFTLTGNPNVGVSGDFSFGNQQYSGGLSYDGGFDWSADDGRSGTCGIGLDANFDLDATNLTGSASVSGKVCNISVNNSVSVDN